MAPVISGYNYVNDPYTMKPYSGSAPTNMYTNRLGTVDNKPCNDFNMESCAVTSGSVFPSNGGYQFNSLSTNNKTVESSDLMEALKASSILSLRQKVLEQKVSSFHGFPG